MGLGLDNDGSVVSKNRAFRRKWKNRAMLEGRPKKYYTTKKTKGRRRRHG